MTQALRRVRTYIREWILKVDSNSYGPSPYFMIGRRVQILRLVSAFVRDALLPGATVLFTLGPVLAWPQEIWLAPTQPRPDVAARLRANPDGKEDLLAQLDRSQMD